MFIEVKKNDKEECYDLIDTDSDQSHDGEGACELIAKVFDPVKADLIALLLNRECNISEFANYQSAYITRACDEGSVRYPKKVHLLLADTTLCGKPIVNVIPWWVSDVKTHPPTCEKCLDVYHKRDLNKDNLARRIAAERELKDLF